MFLPSLSTSTLCFLKHFLHQHQHIWGIGKDRLTQHHPNKTQLVSKFNSTQGFVVVFKHNNFRDNLEGKVIAKTTSQAPSGKEFKGQSHNFLTKNT